MNLSALREQVRAEVNGQQTSKNSTQELSAAERAAVRAMQRRIRRPGMDETNEPTQIWWF